MFYERTALSKDKAAMLAHGAEATSADRVSAEDAIKEPFVLEFLGPKDEYSENDLEDALITHWAEFLLELGDDFTFLARQRRLRLDDNWSESTSCSTTERCAACCSSISRSDASPTRTPAADASLPQLCP